MKKRQYISPEMEIIYFETEDVITTSDGTGAEPEPVETEGPPMGPWDD